jgi:hypothetical protein
LNKIFRKNLYSNFSELDCYRRKQRGDCNSLEFYRAAAEKAQYVHNRHHPDQQNSLTNPRSASLRDVTRHPSLTLRQLERQFLSYQPTSNNHEEVCPISLPKIFNSSTYFSRQQIENLFQHLIL